LDKRTNGIRYFWACYF